MESHITENGFQASDKGGSCDQGFRKENECQASDNGGYPEIQSNGDGCTPTVSDRSEDYEEHILWKVKALDLQRQLQHLEWSGVPPFRGKLLDATKVLEDLCRILDALTERLGRIRIDLECLDDGVAESLFGTPGSLHSLANQIGPVCRMIVEFRARACTWNLQISTNATKLCLSGNEDRENLSLNTAGLEIFIIEAVAAVEEFFELGAHFAARRCAAVARARAAIEVTAVEKQKSATALLSEALTPARHVDFPCITEICQRLADCPAEIPETLKLLLSVLSDQAADPRKILKSLTITNEMLHDDQVLSELAALATAPRALQELRELPRDTGLGTAAEESIRMLATEIDRRIRAAREIHAERNKGVFNRIGIRRQRGKNDSLLSSPASTSWLSASPASLESASPGSWSSPASWSPATQAVSPQLSVGSGMQVPVSKRLSDRADWAGDGEGNLRGRAGLEALARRLRFAHGVRAVEHWMRSSLPLLGDIFETFGRMAAALAKIYEELDCLDDGSTGLPLQEVLRSIAPLLLASSKVQASAMEWQQTIRNRADASTENCHEMELAGFFDEALAASDELQRRRKHFTEIRCDAVERVKAAIEAAGARTTTRPR